MVRNPEANWTGCSTALSTDLDLVGDAERFSLPGHPVHFREVTLRQHHLPAAADQRL